MGQKICGTCAYYMQHYALDKSRIFRVCCGHCIYARAKVKKPQTKACENYEQGSSDSEEFVSKEYLSKKLLKYMLELDLLPKIETMNQ